MSIKDKTKAAVDAIGNLMGCYPEGSRESKTLGHARGMVLDVVMGAQLGRESNALTQDVYNLAGENAHNNLRRALLSQGKVDKLARLLQDNALLDEVLDQLPE